MSVKMEDIDIYNNSAIIRLRKTPKKIISWITILFILSILILVLIQIPFNVFKNYNGIVILKDNKSYVNIKLNESDFPINKDDKLYIKTKLYHYEIIQITTTDLLIKINLEKDIKLNGNIVNINIVKEKTSIFKILKNKIKKGFGL